MMSNEERTAVTEHYCEILLQSDVLILPELKSRGPGGKHSPALSTKHPPCHNVLCRSTFHTCANCQCFILNRLSDILPFTYKTPFSIYPYLRFYQDYSGILLVLQIYHMESPNITHTHTHTHTHISLPSSSLTWKTEASEIILHLYRKVQFVLR
jgi:hypothetical protein